MNSFKFIKSTFIKLTSKTYPYGTEDVLVDEMMKEGIFPNMEKDKWGNYYYKIGDSRTIFASHLDTACREQVDVKHQINAGIISTDGTSILGADDKSGITILLWLIKNKIPGLYYFFIGEEVGCVGSSAAASYGNFRGSYDRIISFDRRGTDSVITFQSSYRCCSDEFATELASQLNLRTDFGYKLDDTGVYTDSAEFVDYIPECTNLSVGYYNEHTTRELQDLYHLNKLALASMYVDWENLPTKRDISKKESKWSSRYTETEYDYYETYDELYSRGCDDWNRDTRNINPSTLSASARYYGSYDNDSDGVTVNKKKKNRSKRNNRSEHNLQGKKYVDRGYGLELMDEPKNQGICDVLRDKFLTTDMNTKEVLSVKEQYLSFKDDVTKSDYDRLAMSL